MKAYIYRAALLCADCATAEQTRLDRIATEHGNPSYAYREDSDRYPQGPYSDGGGEADCPQHCDHCGAFLENPLTPDGYRWLEAELDFRTGDRAILDQWSRFYGIPL